MRVLLVDDEVRFVTALRRGLTAEGYTTEAVHHADDALERALTASFDIIVIDVGLPGTTGYQLTGTLRQHHITTPILMMSAHDDDTHHHRAAEHGADGFLAEPFPFAQLLTRLRALTAP